MELLRATLFHTPRNPFHDDKALEVYSDGGLLVDGGRVGAIGDYGHLWAEHPDAPSTDLRGGFLLPGFVDTHVHFPQVRVLGGLGYTLLDWLSQHTLPEEARMADEGHATEVAGEFVRALVSHGTTTALAFGAHFTRATAILFETAAAAGVRIASGLVLSDRMLLPELHQTPDNAYRDSTDLIHRFHGKGRLTYAVTPRFALSASEAMLEVCQTLLREHPGVRFQSHLNENTREIQEVARLFPWSGDYVGVYEKFGLVGARSVFAHNVHSSDGEVARLAGQRATVSHCPCSNAALGSGFFAMRRHLAAGVRFALGTDVGGGTGFGMLKEALQAYLCQRLCPDGFALTPAQLLFLATRAGAEALGMDAEIGDLSPGKSADFVYLRPPAGSPLEAVIRHANSAERALAALFTLGGSESVREVRVQGDVVYKNDD
jgi:guanine deaminase